MSPTQQAAAEMREACIALLEQRIRAWLADAATRPEAEQVGYPPFTLLEAAQAVRALPLPPGEVTA